MTHTQEPVVYGDIFSFFNWTKNRYFFRQPLAWRAQEWLVSGTEGVTPPAPYPCPRYWNVTVPLKSVFHLWRGTWRLLKPWAAVRFLGHDLKEDQALKLWYQLPVPERYLSNNWEAMIHCSACWPTWHLLTAQLTSCAAQMQGLHWKRHKILLYGGWKK